MAHFRTLDDLGDIKGKRVLVRVDLNVPMADGKVTDATRIERVAPTILELSDKGGKVVLLAHFGRPKDGPDPTLSLEPIARATADIVGRNVTFIPDCVGKMVKGAIFAMMPGDIALLENTRFYKAEEKNEPAFTETLAANGDIFVNDAFSAAHRAHSSTEGLANFLPAYAGRTMQAELDALEKGLGNPERPVVAIVGGAKISTKLDLLMNLVKKVDALVIGGGMANTFLAARGENVGKSLCEHDLAQTARQIMIEAATAGCAIVLPLRRRGGEGVQGRRAARSGGDQRSARRRHDPRCRAEDRPDSQRMDRPRQYACLEWAARRLRDRALRQGDRGSRQARRTAHRGRQTGLGRRRRRYGGCAQPRRRRRRLHLCFDGGRRLPRMDGRQGTARRRGAEGLKFPP